MAKPTRPEAGSAWPWIDFGAVRYLPESEPLNRPMSDPNSIGSPREVPVPCMCKEDTSRPPRDARAMAPAMTRC